MACGKICTLSDKLIVRFSVGEDSGNEKWTVSLILVLVLWTFCAIPAFASHGKYQFTIKSGLTARSVSVEIDNGAHTFEGRVSESKTNPQSLLADLNAKVFIKMTKDRGSDMRRDSLQKALVAVMHCMAESESLDIFSFLARPRAEKDQALPSGFINNALRGYAQFMVSYSGFGEGEKQVLDAFGLSSLVEASTWMSPIKTEAKAPSLFMRMRILLEGAPRFIKLLERTAEEQEIIVETPRDKAPKATLTKKMTFVIRESTQPTLTLKDFGLIIGDIESIFQTVLKIIGSGASDLIVVALDSGSEKSLDVVGVAEAIDKLSTFLLEVWDRIRFARATKARASIKAASEGISLLNELKSSQDKGAITAEEAEKLKRILLKNVDDLFAKGAYTTEMQESIPTRPSELSFQRTKLITHYSNAPTVEQEPPLNRFPPGVEDLDEE